MEEKKRKLSRRRWLEIGIGALLVLLLISWAVFRYLSGRLCLHSVEKCR